LIMVLPFLVSELVIMVGGTADCKFEVVDSQRNTD